MFFYKTGKQVECYGALKGSPYLAVFYMGNSYFKFKQFTIQQQYSAMKVTTDACLFGAWLAAKRSGADSILDIGGGTGLLSLMLAQQTNGVIYAVEKDEATYNEMHLNFENSPWMQRLHAVHKNILDYEPAQTFDLVVTNPPFFENALKSPDSNRNRVLHDTDLTLESLIEAINRLLNSDGRFGILLPIYRTDYFMDLATRHGFSLKKNITVQQTPKHQGFRSMLFFSREAVHSIKEETIIIKNENAEYSGEFQTLLKPYYLYL